MLDSFGEKSLKSPPRSQSFSSFANQTSLHRKELAKMTAKSLDKIELERTALHMSFPSFLQTSFREEAAYSRKSLHDSMLDNEARRGQESFSFMRAAWLSQSAIQLQFLGKELVIHLAFPESQEQPSLSGGASGALAAFSSSSSTKPDEKNFN